MQVPQILENPPLYKEISDESFEQQVIEKCIPAIIALASGRMRGGAMMNAMMEGLASEYSDRVAFFYINPEKSNLPARYGLHDTAAIFFFAKGVLQDYQIGLTSKNKVREKVEAFIHNLSRQ